MLWLGRRSVKGVTREDNERRTYRQSIELPIAIEVAGLPAAVYGTLINLSETGCRLRSLILIDKNRDVTFNLQRPNEKAIVLRGKIVARATPQKGGGYEYGVEFLMTPSEKIALGKEIHEMQRRAGAARADKKAPAPKPAPKGDGKQRRSALRTMVEFPVRYRIGSRGSVAAEANDVSMGGLRLLTKADLPIGTLVELRFKLPNNFLYVYPPAGERTEISPFGPRTVRIPDNRRPFEEMTISGRIVSKFQPQGGREVYGVQFIDAEGYQREEIARFTHSVQLAKLRAPD